MEDSVCFGIGRSNKQTCMPPTVLLNSWQLPLKAFIIPASVPAPTIVFPVLADVVSCFLLQHCTYIHGAAAIWVCSHGTLKEGVPGLVTIIFFFQRPCWHCHLYNFGQCCWFMSFFNLLFTGGVKGDGYVDVPSFRNQNTFYSSCICCHFSFTLYKFMNCNVRT